MKELYPCVGLHTALHVTEIGSKQTLCGINPPRAWEMAYQGEAFPEIGDFEVKHFATNGEGFYVGRSFAGDYVFCKKCYNSLKARKGILKK